MLDVCPLGTGGITPLLYRWLTSIMTRCNDSSLLIDCGEGAQITLREKGWSPYLIGIIYFTHYHVDHVSGLPDLSLTMDNAERIEPLLMISPKELGRMMTMLRSIAPELPFPIVFSELTEAREQRTADPCVVGAYHVDHNVLCYGYCISIPHIGRFDATRAREQGIPLKFWNPLQKGQAITGGNKVYTPDIVLGGTRRGLKVSYCTNTRPVPTIAECVADADLMICGSMYSEADKQQKAREHEYVTMQGAAKLASEAKLKGLWLTYYSPSLNYPEECIAEIRKIFPAAKTARDGWTMEFVFPERA